MIAVVMLADGVTSAVSLYLSALGLLIAGIVLAPQSFKRDKRVIVGMVLVVLFVVIGHAMEAGPWICPYQDTWFEFLCFVP